MKALIVSEAKDNQGKFILTSIYELLRKANQSVSVISRGEMMTKNFSGLSIIFIHNLLLSGILMQKIKSLNIPRVLICEVSTFYKFSDYDLSIFNKILIIKDTNTKTWNNYLWESSIALLDIPFIANEGAFNPENGDVKRILVSFKSNYQKELLVSIAKVLNSVPHHEIRVTSSPKFVHKILDMNVKPVRISRLDECIRDSDLIIGNGLIILLSILACKPAIVVGEYGYGGLIDDNQIEKQYGFSFSGRIGGEFGEIIPQRLLFDDIMTVLKMRPGDINLLVNKNMEYLRCQQELCQNRFNSIIDKVLNDTYKVQNDFLNCRLVASQKFSFSKLVNGEYIVTVKDLNHYIGVIDQVEFDLVQRFKTGKKVCHIIDDNDLNNEAKCKEIIIGLINDKLLTII